MYEKCAGTDALGGWAGNLETHIAPVHVDRRHTVGKPDRQTTEFISQVSFDGSIYNGR